jgi:4-hydroxyphenylpyruvate dioxygenase-like putative hemolysin
MSNVFGGVVQQGYVVPDIDAAMRHWLARGVGPFYMEHLKEFPGELDGKSVALELKAAFAYSGDQQIEVIEPIGPAPSIYGEYLKAHPRGGLQHLAVWCEGSIAETLAELERRGMAFAVRQTYGDQHAYIDSVDQPGVMMQLMARGEMIEKMFAIIKEGADTWDGVTDPVRRLDWSSGTPVVKPLAA